MVSISSNAFGSILVIFITSLIVSIITVPNIKPLLTDKSLYISGVIDLKKYPNPAEFIISETEEKRGLDVAIECVGLPEMWEKMFSLVRKGGCVHFFGGCASGSKIELDTKRLHYDEVKIISSFHHTPQYFREALDMIASGPACPDTAASEDAWRIQKKYALTMSEEALKLLDMETPKSLDNVHTQINGSVRELCVAVAKECERLGYEPILLTDQLCCQAKEAGSFLASIAKTHARDGKAMAFIAGGETVVKLTGKGLGGRNQEIALAAAAGISGLPNVAIFSVGSDGTDGPTDAAGGYADGDTCLELIKKGLSIDDVLRDNDAYHALQITNGLIITGPTGTNVNDVAIALLQENA